MSTRVLVWLGAVMVAAIVVAVLWVLVWAACWSVAWVWNWWPWRFRGDDQDAATEDEELPPLPPERSWEQMTSRQLPLVPAAVTIDGRSIAQGYVYLGTNRESLAPQGERLAPWWEAEHRAAYESLGFEFPSGLMARVREAAL